MKWMIVLSTTALLCIHSLVLCAREVKHETATGGINWSQGIVYATGFGTASRDKNAAQRRLLSRRAAVVDAQRNLLEITRGVRISSELKTGQAMKFITLEDEARWAIQEGLASGPRIPNYLNFVITDPLDSVKPDAVRIIR